ncbi:hypothetical protein [Chryseobacterium indoltheticum]|uniref:Uncharacterized protein n=1 Tax=Chryseobacterium indoltheticum TaxID=254 RepID=A0A381FIN2_9FLAO|nr:hypothetical protein [Chryseobacterium indoltheticum]SUX46391.1 Uncharacterised protein [Chryseobacterium indoltheticum]
MNKINLQKQTCYKINLPSECDLDKALGEYIDFNMFNNISKIIDSFSFDSEKYDNLHLSDYVDKYNLDKSLIFFYTSMKNLTIGKLSVKQKIILSIIENIKHDCLIISLEALSERTRLYLISISYLLTNYQGSKTFIFLDFSTLKIAYERIEVKTLEPSWIETSVN